MAVRNLRSAADLDKLSRFLVKKYRDSYLESMVRTGISSQVYALRKKVGLSQSQFAKKTGKPQSTISRLENETYGKVTITSLLDIAKSNDVGLLVRFVDYPTVLDFAGKMSETELQPHTVTESIDIAKSEPPHWRVYMAQTPSQGQKEQPKSLIRLPSSEAIWSRIGQSDRTKSAARNYLDNIYATN